MTQRPLVATLALIALVGAGCGSNAPSKTTSSSAAKAGSADTGTKVTAQDKAVKFSECIRSHGVPHFPDPDSKGEFNFGIDVSQEVWRAAVAACKDLQPPGSLSSKRTAKQQSTALKFAQCMRDHGVKDFPDPANGEPLIDTTKIPSLGDRSPVTDPVFRPAVDACGDALAAALRDRK
jgi:hypothetical protein